MRTFEDKQGTTVSALKTGPSGRTARSPSPPVVPRRAADVAGAALAAPAISLLTGTSPFPVRLTIAGSVLSDAVVSAALAAALFPLVLGVLGDRAFPDTRRAWVPRQAVVVIAAGAVALAASLLWPAPVVASGGLWLVCAGALSLAARAAGARFTRPRPFVILGAGRPAREVAAALLDTPGGPVTPVAFVDGGAAGAVVLLDSGPLAPLALPVCEPDHRSLRHLLHRFGAAGAIVPPGDPLPAGTLDDLTECAAAGFDVVCGADALESIAGRVLLPEADPHRLAHSLGPFGARRVYRAAKRLVDIVAGVAGLVAFAPLLALAAAAVKAETPGPAFYRQTRVGEHGTRFRIWKLRTMFVGTDDPPSLTQPDDPRVTRVGRWLRRSRLDEAPQLINVVLGQMSLVGPRPEQPFEAQANSAIPGYALRHAMKPGLAGWAAVLYRYVDDIHGARARLEYDLYYLKHRSLLLDLQIVLRAVAEGVRLRGR